MIGNIEKEVKVILENVLCVSGEFTQPELMILGNRIDNLLLENNTQRTGNAFIATNNVTVEKGQQILDIDMYIPLDSMLNDAEGFTFIPEFSIENALKMTVKGSPEQFETAVQGITTYIDDNNLSPLTPIYVETANPVTDAADLDNLVTNFYIGVE
ncbi:MAG: hypothetical protein IKE52_06965 [Mogibacterium sp.]|nr:hypothetical protein [Mogibacterium sp.]